MVNKRKTAPRPEFLDGGDWTVIESPIPRMAGSRLAPGGGGQMSVPMGARNAAERVIRLQEMVGAQITPRGLDYYGPMGDLPEPLVTLVEQCRIHGQMERIDFDVSPGGEMLDVYEREMLAKKAHPATLAATAAAMYGMNVDGDMLSLIAAADTERRSAWEFGMSIAAHRFRDPDLEPFEDVIDAVRDIIDLYGDPSDPPPPPPPPPPPGSPPPPPPLVPDKRKSTYAIKPRTLKEEQHEWGRMDFEEPPLTQHLPGHMKSRRKNVAEVRGRRLRRPGRLFADQRVFSHKPPTRGGGSVLIDCSGSMGLTPDEVRQLTELFPAGVIGAYSGEGHDEKGLEKGVLRVIARKGRRVDDHLMDTPGNGNSVDGPALDWLAKQQGPRYWISDAGVTGGAWGLRYCVNVCKKANITRVDNAQQLIGKEVH